jgi:phosphatidate phosphatase APP1
MTRRAAPQGRRNRVSYFLRRALHLLARPVRAARGRGTVAINCYRGYGSDRELFLIGRVFRQPGYLRTRRRGTLWRDLRAVTWRLLRYGMRDAVLAVRFGETEQEVTTDRDGYFRVHMRLENRPAGEGLWHPMEIALRRPEEPDASAKGEVFIPPATARTLVISDIDDTVVHTGVANKLVMLWRLFFQGAHSRVAFPGVAAFYRALHDGTGGAAGGSEVNPMLYVSRGPWSIYEVMTEFFHRHRIPIGPVLFLREWGLTLQRPLPPRARDHKVTLIRHMMEIYEDMPVVLIGDSGQHDAELYAGIVDEYPGRVRAVYIRNVSRSGRRPAKIAELARGIEAAGSSLVLAADSGVMARHAAGLGLIREDALPNILRAVARERVDADAGDAAVEGSGAE